MEKLLNKTIKMYGKPQCGYCERAITLFTNNKVAFEYIDVSTDSVALGYIKGLGCRTVPQIFIDNEHIGGYDDLVLYLQE